MNREKETGELPDFEYNVEQRQMMPEIEIFDGGDGPDDIQGQAAQSIIKTERRIKSQPSDPNVDLSGGFSFQICEDQFWQMIQKLIKFL